MEFKTHGKDNVKTTPLSFPRNDGDSKIIKKSNLWRCGNVFVEMFCTEWFVALTTAGVVRDLINLKIGATSNDNKLNPKRKVKPVVQKISQSRSR